jgi:hypothetical protein
MTRTALEVPDKENDEGAKSPANLRVYTAPPASIVSVPPVGLPA